MNDPFQAPTLVAKKLRVLLYGPPGTGKTSLALQFPRPALIDMEGGADFYAHRFNYKVLRTKSAAEVEKALEFLKADAGKTYDTVIIDPVTVLWTVITDGYKQGREYIPFDMWAKIKGRLRKVYDTLLSLPIHVVIIAREKDDYQVAPNAKGKAEPEKIGVKPDIEKGMPYIFDAIVHLEMDGDIRRGVVEKDRTGMLGSVIEDMTFTPFAKILAAPSVAAVDVYELESAAIDEIAQQSIKEATAEPTSQPHAASPVAPRFSAQVSISKDMLTEFDQLLDDVYGDNAADKKIEMLDSQNVSKASELSYSKMQGILKTLRGMRNKKHAEENPLGMLKPRAVAETGPASIAKLSRMTNLIEDLYPDSSTQKEAELLAGYGLKSRLELSGGHADLIIYGLEQQMKASKPDLYKKKYAAKPSMSTTERLQVVAERRKGRKAAAELQEVAEKKSKEEEEAQMRDDAEYDEELSRIFDIS